MLYFELICDINMLFMLICSDEGHDEFVNIVTQGWLEEVAFSDKSVYCTLVLSLTLLIQFFCTLSIF